VLPNGKFLLANQFSQAMAVLDPATLTWTNLNATNKADNNSEETWTLLPDGTILTTDCQNGTTAEKYSIANDQWYSAGSTQVTLPSNAGYPTYVPEIGPQILRPNGTIIAFGGTSNTAIYTPDPNINNPGSWVAGPTFPGGDDCADAPGVLLRNG